MASFLLTFSLLLPLSSSISPSTVTTAADILSDTGFTSMSLTLPLISKPLISAVSSATIFTPSDDSFSLSLSSGQPSLSLLQFHFSPSRYSAADLRSLSFGSQIPSLLPNHPLTVTTSIFHDQVSINGVKVKPSPVFDDGFLTIYEIERFLNPNYRFGLAATSSALSPSPIPIPNQLECSPPSHGGSYGGATAAMRSQGFSSMAAFLDLQISQFSDDVSNITVFAPNDAAMEGHFGNYSGWPWGSEAASLLRRHVVPCEVTWSGMNGLSGDGSVVLSTFLDGFVVKVSRSGKSLVLNGEIPVDFPEVYSGDRIIVHGLSRVVEVDGREKVHRGGEPAYTPASNWMYEF